MHKRYFIALKLIHGDTLANLLKRQGHGANRWLSVFESLCQAVGYAHETGYVHRDLKPANVMVGMFSEVKVMDWGLAKKIADPTLANLDKETVSFDITNTHGSAAETRAGTVMGTPHYMAPEQARGDILNIDRRTDVFALGAILFEILTGKTPFTGTSSEVIQRCISGDFDSFHREFLGCGEDPKLISLAKRCLEYDPANRPKDGREVAEIVSAIRRESDQRARETEIRLAGAELKLIEQKRRRKIWTSSIMAMMVMLVLGILSSAMLTQRAQKSEHLARELADSEKKLNDKLRASLQEIESSHETIVKIFQNLDIRNTRANMPTVETRIISQLVDSSQHISESKNRDPLWIAREKFHFGETILHLGDPRTAVKLFQEAAALQSQILGPDDRETLTSLNSLVEARTNLGFHQEALELLNEIQPRATRQFGEIDSLTLGMKINRMAALSKMEHTPDAIPFGEKTVQEAIIKWGNEHEETITAKNNLAVLHQKSGRIDRTIEIQSEILPLLKEKYGVNHPFVITSLFNLAEAYITLNQLDKSIPLLQECVRRAQAVLNTYDPLRIKVVTRLAWIYRDVSRWSESAELFRQLDQSQSVLYGTENMKTIHNRALAADGLRLANRTTEAIQLYDGLRLHWSDSDVKFPNDPVPIDMMNYTDCLVKVGRHVEAAKFAEEIYRRRFNQVGPEHPWTVDALQKFALIQFHSLQPQKAVNLFERLIPILEKQQGPRSIQTIQNRSRLGTVYSQLDRHEKAIQYFKTTMEILASLPMEEPEKLACQNQFASAYLRAGQISEAISLFREVRNQFNMKMGPYSKNSFIATLNLAKCLYKHGDENESKQLFKSMLDIYRLRNGALNEEDANFLTNSTAFLLEIRWYNLAEQFAREELIVREAFHPDAWSTYNTRAYIGEALYGQGKIAEAEPYLSISFQGLNQRYNDIPEIKKSQLYDAAYLLIEVYKKTNRSKQIDTILKKLPREEAPFPTPVDKFTSK
ncbi:MAG: serine/threonine-protein kinase [Gemmataceae bacterium]